MRKTLWIIAIALVVALPAYGRILSPIVGGVAAVGVSCTGTSKYSQTADNGSFLNLFRTANNIDTAAIKFTAGSDFTICSIDVTLTDMSPGTAPNFHVIIVNDNAGAPTGSQVGGVSATYGTVDVPDTKTVFNIAWTTNYPTISNGNTYWALFVNEAGLANNYYKLHGEQVSSVNYVLVYDDGVGWAIDTNGNFNAVINIKQ